MASWTRGVLAGGAGYESLCRPAGDPDVRAGEDADGPR